MTNPLRRSLAKHADRLNYFSGDTVTYWRGSSSVRVTAVPGSTSWDDVDAEGETRITTKTEDFLFDARTFKLDGSVIEPMEGDYIVDADGWRFDVVAGMSTSRASWSNPQRSHVRVHAVRRMRVE